MPFGHQLMKFLFQKKSSIESTNMIMFGNLGRGATNIMHIGYELRI